MERSSCRQILDIPKSLHFIIFYSLDETNDYEIAPVASFDPTLPDRISYLIINDACKSKYPNQYPISICIN